MTFEKMRSKTINNLDRKRGVFRKQTVDVPRTLKKENPYGFKPN